MRANLLLHYENELAALRQNGAEFAAKYPKIASRLALEPTKCEDPHVERLLEGFAYLAARVQLKLEDEFPLITESLLETLYPSFLRPIPSLSIAEFVLDPESGALTTGFALPRGSRLYSRPVNGVPCRFRTCYDSTLWPLTVSAAEWRGPERLPIALRQPDCAGAIRVELKGPVGELKLDRIRFFLDGDSTLVHTLYEMLNRDVLRISVGGNTLPASALRPVGFEADEGVLDYSGRSFLGYRLLQEYFAFPDKFFFLDLEIPAGAAKGDSLEIYFLATSAGGEQRRQRLELHLNAKTFRLNCVPVVNLFEQTCEPITLDHHRYEYAVTPDARRPHATEIYSIDDVAYEDAATREIHHVRPFFQRKGDGHYWVSYRRQSPRPQDPGTDVSIAIVDGDHRHAVPPGTALTVRATCTNRDLPARLPFGDPAGDFELDGHAPITRIVALRKPTPALYPPGGPGSLWNLLSHLSLNHLSLVNEGRVALQQLLRLTDYSGSAFHSRSIEGITAVASRPHFARLISEHGIAFVRGTAVEMELDEEQFAGGGVYLFASVMERFLAHYCSLNSFSQLTARVKQRKEALREWAPRSGQRILL
jgi:type VI secretion system protein ImpG